MYRVTPTHLEALKISQTGLCALKTPTYTLDGGFTLELQISVKLHRFRRQPARSLFLLFFHEWSFDTLSDAFLDTPRVSANCLSQIIVFVFSQIAF